MAPRKPMTVEAAETKLRAMLENPPYRRDPTTGSTTFFWERPQYRAFEKLLDALPPGVDEKLLDEVLAIKGAVTPGTEYIGRAPNLDAAVIRFHEAHEATVPECAFVAVTTRSGGTGTLHDRMNRAMWFLHGSWIGKINRAGMQARIAELPAIVEGARAAAALETYPLQSQFWPILLADGSADSLDVILPKITEILAKGSVVERDWLTQKVLPLLADTKAANAVRAMIGVDAAEILDERSPALDWMVALGNPSIPDTASFTVSFRDAAKRTVYQFRCDSKRDAWFEGRYNDTHPWAALTPEVAAAKIPTNAVAYLLRCARGTPRDCVDRWAKSLLPRP